MYEKQIGVSFFMIYMPHLRLFKALFFIFISIINSDSKYLKSII